MLSPMPTGETEGYACGRTGPTRRHPENLSELRIRCTNTGTWIRDRHRSG